MVSLFALYRRPEDEEAFLSYYRDVHVPLASRMPGLAEIQWGKQELIGSEDPSDPWFVVAEMRFKDRASLMAAVTSEQGKAAAEDTKYFAEGLLTMRVVEWE